MLGQIVGSYSISREIGAGGMGKVYLGQHTLLGRPAAIKVLLREMSHRPDLVARFFNEARAATSVKHPGIVEIYDFGYHADGSAYIVMELLEGETLSSRLRRTGPPGELRATALARQIGGALAAAHTEGIVHRDLKPDNVFIVRDPDVMDGERTKILDFGIAKLSDDGHGSSQTRTGMVMGTPMYMSPEQCKGSGRIDHRADLYALGCILYELVCGRPPFVADGPGEVMAQHIFAAVPPPGTIAAASVSPAFERVVLRALAKDPADRFGSVDELLAALPAVAGASRPVFAVPATGPAVAAAQLGTPAGATTVSSASGAISTPSAALVTTRRWPAVVVTASALVVLALAGALLLRGHGATTTAVPAATSPAVAATPAAPASTSAVPSSGPVAPANRTAAPASVPAAPAGVPAVPAAPPTAAAGAATPAPPTVPRKITIRLASTPPGAEVYRMSDGVRLGVTPLDHAVDAVTGDLVVILKLRGYRDQTVSVPADRDGDRTIALVRIPVRGAASASVPQTSPDFFSHTPAPAAPSTGSIDPFNRPSRTP